MQKLLKITGYSLIFACAFAVADASWAAETARGASARGRDRVAVSTATSRMPSIPILPVSATGNITFSQDVIDPEPTPEPTPGPTPGPTPTPVPVCPDGGVMNSAYTVQDCMNDVLACVNGGALPNGINSLYDEDVRNSIMNGMGLCMVQVDKCISTVRVNCQNVYESSADVWIDFNIRKVQPSYYAFVLRQTGLTPTQAKNTCLLLDRNTYGSSLDAVGQNDLVTSEYGRDESAYNRTKHTKLVKKNPQGVEVNNDGQYDAKRGYYARWDAEKAECLLRVAAYKTRKKSSDNNSDREKDELITNDWWFGGDNKPAEVWQATGSTFTCNKDLFGFALRTTTKDVAVLAGASTLVGAGVGALTGHKATTGFDCNDAELRKKLLKEIKEKSLIAGVNTYITDKNKRLSLGMSELDSPKCEAVVDAYTRWIQLEQDYNTCKEFLSADPCESYVFTTLTSDTGAILTDDNITVLTAAIRAKEQNECRDKKAQELAKRLKQCSFENLGTISSSCNDTTGQKCIPFGQIGAHLRAMTAVFEGLTVLNEGRKSTKLKNTLIGAGIGAGVGGAAVAISAFVEGDRISCRVGDDLERVNLNKSYTIGRLRDYYVKWALNLPNAMTPTAVVTNCENWALSCNLYTDPTECKSAIFNYRPGGLATTQEVQNPCQVSGSACIANLTTANNYGLCLNTFPTVNNCDQWRNECAKFTDVTSCDAAQFYYAPMSTTVSRACVYSVGGNTCGMNSSVAGNYVNMSTCSYVAEPSGPAVQ